MSANDPRVEFRPRPDVRRRLEELRLELSKKAGRNLSLSEVVSAVVEAFFESEKRGS
jgi:cobalamin biosynthesis protein CobD/CbiB